MTKSSDIGSYVKISHDTTLLSLFLSTTLLVRLFFPPTTSCIFPSLPQPIFPEFCPFSSAPSRPSYPRVRA